MSYKCRVQYEDESGEEQEVHLTTSGYNQYSAEKALEEYDPKAVYVDHEFEETEEGCEIKFCDCNGTTQVLHREIPRSLESESEEAANYVWECGWGIDTAYGYPELLFDSEKEEQEKEEAAEEAKKVRVEWDDKNDVLSLFHRCVATLSRDFNLSLKKLKREVKENFVEGVMES